MRSSWIIVAAIGVAVSSPAAAENDPSGDIARNIISHQTANIAVPPLRDRADHGDVFAQCILVKLDGYGQDVGIDAGRLMVMRKSCVANTHHSDGRTPPPALPVPQRPSSQAPSL